MVGGVYVVVLFSLRNVITDLYMAGDEWVHTLPTILSLNMHNMGCWACCCWCVCVCACVQWDDGTSSWDHPSHHLLHILRAGPGESGLIPGEKGCGI